MRPMAKTAFYCCQLIRNNFFFHTRENVSIISYLNLAQPPLRFYAWYTIICLSKLLSRLTWISRLSYQDIFRQVLCCCHVPGCHEVDIVTRTRCELHAANLMSCFCIQNPAPKLPILNWWNRVSHTHIQTGVSVASLLRWFKFSPGKKN